MKRRFGRGAPWEYEGANRSFLAYLKSASRRPGFFVGLTAAFLFAAGGYTRWGFSHGGLLYLGVLGTVLAVGYIVWLDGGCDLRTTRCTT